MNPSQAQTHAIARITALGAAYGIDVTEALKRLTPVASYVGDFLMVTVPHTFDRISMSTQVLPGPDALDLVGAVCGAEQRAIATRFAGPELRFLGVELEARNGAPLGVTVHAFGARNLESDLARLGELGVNDAAREAARQAATALGGDQRLVAVSSLQYDDARSFVLRIAQPNHDEEDAARTRERIAAAGATVGVTQAQLNVVESLHDALAKDRDTHVSLRVGSDALEAELGVIWARVAWPTIVRMMVGFYRGQELGPQLGILGGAFESEVAASLELVLGNREPPGMRIAGVQRAGVVPG